MDKLAYVLSSTQREKVLAAVIPSPKTPVQISALTNLRLPHVSRALRQLAEADLVRGVGGERRGRQYAPSDLGRAVFLELAQTRGDRVVAPMIRGSHFRNYHHWVATSFDRKAADDILRTVGVDPARVDPDGWYPLRAALETLDLIEARFGDGTFDIIRRMLREEARHFASIKRLALRIVPFPILLELAPNSYNREFNHGRLEVEVGDRRALMKNYDWMSSPARCAAWLGVYEGSLELLGRIGSVTKVGCILRGDPYCGYQIEW